MSILAMQMLKMPKSPNCSLFNFIQQCCCCCFGNYLWKHIYILLVLTLTDLFPFFSFAVLVPLTRSVYKPATRILSLQSEIEKRRKNPQDNNCPPTNPPISPDSTSHLILNISKQRRKLQQHYAFRGTLDTFTQSEGGPV